MDKEIRLNVDGVLNNGQEVLENGIGPLQAPLRMPLVHSGNLEPEMGIRSMNEIQWDLFNPDVSSEASPSCPVPCGETDEWWEKRIHCLQPSPADAGLDSGCSMLVGTNWKSRI